MDNRPVTTQEVHVCHKACISWSAIAFGALVAVGLGILGQLFSLSVGLTAFPMTPEGKSAYACWGLVGLSVISIITMYIAGWTAGVLGRSHCCQRSKGEFYGFAAWALALVVSIVLASQIGQFFNQRVYSVDRSYSTFQMVHEVSKNVNQVSEAADQSTSAEVKESATALGETTFATFFILFVGALAAAFGGRIGMRCQKAVCCPRGKV